MIRTMTLFASLIVGAGAAAGAELADTPYDAELQAALDIGHQLFVHERAQAAAESAGRKLRGFRRDRRVQGVLSVSIGEEIQLEYVGVEEGATLVFYRARSDGDGRVDALARLTPPEPLAAARESAWQARTRAQQYPMARCWDDIRIVVLPAWTGEPGVLSAYVLAKPDRSGTAPIGGNYRLDVAGNGAILRHRAFAKGCIELRSEQIGEGMIVTHALDPHPTEIHVLAQRRMRTPLYVVAVESGMIWSIEPERIRLVRERND